MTFARYALYFAPPADADWTQWASAWLGWDMETGQPLPHPDMRSPGCRDDHGHPAQIRFARNAEAADATGRRPDRGEPCAHACARFCRHPAPGAP